MRWRLWFVKGGDARCMSNRGVWRIASSLNTVKILMSVKFNKIRHYACSCIILHGLTNSQYAIKDTSKKRRVVTS